MLTRRYSAFGTPVAAKVWSTLPIADFTDISSKSGFFYVGQEYDATTGLQYSRARYYDPVSNGNRNNGGYLTDRDNRLVNDPAYVYTYDAEGNRASREALAVRNATQGGVQVVDNTPSTTGGSWTTTGAGYGGSQQVGTPTLNSRATASWQASTLPAGSYDVYATWSSIDNGLTSAPYTLTTTDGGITIQTITSAHYPNHQEVRARLRRCLVLSCTKLGQGSARHSLHF